MLLSDLDKICQDSAFIIRILVTVIKIVRWVIPIILILLISFDLYKVMASNPDDKTKKTALEKVVKRLIYTLIIFLIPTIINFTFKTIDKLLSKDSSIDSTPTTWLGCWTKIYGDPNYGTTYSAGSYSTPAPASNNNPVYQVPVTTPAPAPTVDNRPVPDVKCEFSLKTSSGYVGLHDITIDSEVLKSNSLGTYLECISPVDGTINYKINDPTIIGWRFFAGSPEFTDELYTNDQEYMEINPYKIGETSITVTFTPNDNQYRTFTDTYRVIVNDVE